MHNELGAVSYLQYKWGIDFEKADANKDGIVNEADYDLLEKLFVQIYNWTAREVCIHKLSIKITDTEKKQADIQHMSKESYVSRSLT